MTDEQTMRSLEISTFLLTLCCQIIMTIYTVFTDNYISSLGWLLSIFWLICYNRSNMTLRDYFCLEISSMEVKMMLYEKIQNLEKSVEYWKSRSKSKKKSKKKSK